MTYAKRLLIEFMYGDGVPCACFQCTMRRLKKERDRRRLERKSR